MLSEIPRVKRLLEERIADVEASGCTPEEANIIAHQVIEEQKRTLDEEKRRRLSNVLISGLCAKQWEKSRHRLMVRLAAQLEEEHIEHLHGQARTPEYLERRKLEREARSKLSIKEREKASRRDDELAPVRDAIERELISLGLLTEITEQVPNSRWKEPPLPTLNRDGKLTRERRNTFDKREPEFVDKTHVRIALLGHQFLRHLRDPEAPDEPK